MIHNSQKLQQQKRFSITRGFTLIEVLLALSIIAIALTALLQATSHNIAHMDRIKDKTISHWVAMQGIAMLQLNLLQTANGQASTQTTTMLGKSWYWRAKTQATSLKKTQKITILIADKPQGPYREELTGYRYQP
jgi:general secretion pathway protein I